MKVAGKIKERSWPCSPFQRNAYRSASACVMTFLSREAACSAYSSHKPSELAPPGTPVILMLSGFLRASARSPRLSPAWHGPSSPAIRRVCVHAGQCTLLGGGVGPAALKLTNLWPASLSSRTTSSRLRSELKKGSWSRTTPLSPFRAKSSLMF